MLPQILTFDFDLILGSFLTFFGPNGLFLDLRKGSKIVLGSTHIVEQLLSSMMSSILSFYFDLISGSLFTFWVSNGLFWILGRAQKLFWGLLM